MTFPAHGQSGMVEKCIESVPLPGRACSVSGASLVELTGSCLEQPVLMYDGSVRTEPLFTMKNPTLAAIYC